MAESGRPETPEGQHGNVRVTPQKQAMQKQQPDANGKLRWQDTNDNDGTLRWRTARSGEKAQRWEAATYYKSADGKRKLLRVIGDSKAAAQQNLQAKIDQEKQHTGLSGQYQPNMLVRQAAEKWFTSWRNNKTLATVEQYERAIRLHVNPYAGSLKLRKWNVVSRLEAWLQEVADNHGVGAAKTAKTVARNILNAAVRDDALPSNKITELRGHTQPSPGSPGDKQLEDKKRALTPQEWERLIATARNSERWQHNQLDDILVYLIHTGVRRQELIDQTWADIHLNAKTPWLHVPGTKSSRAPRDIAITPDLANLLHQRAKRYGTEGLLFPRVGKIDHTAKPSPHEPRDGRNLLRLTKLCATEAGLVDPNETETWVDVHTTRHTCATWMHHSGITPAIAAGRLGQSVDTYIKNYVDDKPSIETQRQALAANPLQLLSAP